MGAVLLGLVVAFLLAALVEAYVTGRPWPTSARVGIGVIVFTVFWGWVIHFALAQVAATRRSAPQSRPAAFSDR
jgi:uncharacterized membrane protein YczE